MDSGELDHVGGEFTVAGGGVEGEAGDTGEVGDVVCDDGVGSFPFEFGAVAVFIIKIVFWVE